MDTVSDAVPNHLGIVASAAGEGSESQASKISSGRNRLGRIDLVAQDEFLNLAGRGLGNGTEHY